MSDETEAIESAVVKEYGYEVYAFYYVSAHGEPLNCQFESEREAWKAATELARDLRVQCGWAKQSQAIAENSVGDLLIQKALKAADALEAAPANPAPPAPDVAALVAQVCRAIASAHYEGFQDGKKGNNYSTFDKSRALANARSISATLAHVAGELTIARADVAAVLARHDAADLVIGMSWDNKTPKERAQAVSELRESAEAMRETLARVAKERDAAIARAEAAESDFAQCYLKQMKAENNGTISLDVSSKAVEIMAFHLANMIVGHGAQNYVTMECVSRAPEHAEIGPMVLTLQKKWAKTPHECRKDAEAERDALRAERDNSNALIARVVSILSSDWEPDGDLTQIEDLAVTLRADLSGAKDIAIAQQAEITDWKQSFDMYTKCIQRATKAWYTQNPGSRLVLPDGAKTLCAFFDQTEGWRKELDALRPILDCEITEGDWHAKTMRVTIPVDGKITMGYTLRHFFDCGGVVRGVKN